MNIGMLWFDNDARANLDTKIERAARHYRKKYGKAPTLCFIHPSMLPARENQEANGNGQSAEKLAQPEITNEKSAQTALQSAGLEVR